MVLGSLGLDIAEGLMANDTIFNYVQNFVKGSEAQDEK